MSRLRNVTNERRGLNFTRKCKVYITQTVDQVALQFLLSSGVRSGYTSSRAARSLRSSTNGNRATPGETNAHHPLQLLGSSTYQLIFSLPINISSRVPLLIAKHFETELYLDKIKV